MRTLIEWRAYAWISLGAIAGANLRYLFSKIITRFSDAAFPYGTLFINITGSFILGFFLIWTTERVLANPLWRWLIAVGFCGSYTTFSSYAFETMAYFEQGNWGLFAANFLANNLLCLGAVLVGMVLARGI
ncbi:MAG TPA: fluoride efflux transporter CrcB [Candidatus Angelobacter sp.]|nr:fluoride efflux transporter CrcB [Candidatus Angelobacter sp.]